MIKSRSPVSTLLLAALISVLPMQIRHSGMTFGSSTALAKDGGSGDNSGQGGGDDSGHGGNSGPGGGDGSGSDDQKGERDGSLSGGTARKDRQQLNRKYFYGPHGERIEIRGSSIVVIYADGFSETIRDGFLELIDPQNRRVVKRRANGKDVSRIRALVRF